MSLESCYARFMELRGRTLVEGAGALWYSVSGRLLMPVRYHVPIAPDEELIHQMLGRSRHLGARFASHTFSGLATGRYVFRAKSHGIEDVQQKSRSLVRRGLKDCEIRLCTPDELLEQGLQINRGTMERQGRFDAEFGEPKQWERLVNAIFACSPTVSAMGAFVGDKLAGYAVLCREEGWLHILHQFSHRDLLPHRPNDALAFTLSKISAEDPEIEAVCYGLTGLVDREGLHRFKLAHGYQVEEFHDAFVLHPAASAVLVSAPALWAVRKLRTARPGNQTLERVESVMEGAYKTRLGLREVIA